MNSFQLIYSNEYSNIQDPPEDRFDGAEQYLINNYLSDEPFSKLCGKSEVKEAISIELSLFGCMLKGFSDDTSKTTAFLAVTWIKRSLGQYIAKEFPWNSI